MQIYQKTNGPFFCGHWNGSPVQIGMTQIIRDIPPREAYHYHDYHEYYVGLYGKAILNVEGREVALEANTVVMVQPGERHRIIWVDPELGVQWLVIKEQSIPNSKTIVPEDR